MAQKPRDAVVNFLSKFTAASRGPPCDSTASCLAAPCIYKNRSATNTVADRSVAASHLRDNQHHVTQLLGCNALMTTRWRLFDVTFI